jgi:hypothetical protein
MIFKINMKTMINKYPYQDIETIIIVIKTIKQIKVQTK